MFFLKEIFLGNVKNHLKKTSRVFKKLCTVKESLKREDFLKIIVGPSESRYLIVNLGISNCPIDLKLATMIPETVRYNVGSVATLSSLLRMFVCPTCCFLETKNLSEFV